MQITAATDAAAITGPPENFTGAVRIDAMSSQDDACYSAAIVSFTPGARSAWHSHPAGQTLMVISGVGWIQVDGGERRTIRAGDVVWCEPGERHWHGATADQAMSHVAIQQIVDGTPVHWEELVDDATYHGA